MSGPQMCAANELLGGEPCLRVAQWEWRPEDDAHPVFLCNFHAEPLGVPPDRPAEGEAAP